MATTSSSTTTGINISGISSITAALSTYKSKVVKACDISAKKSVIESAIKGTSSEANLKTFINKIETQLASHVKNVTNYEKTLNTVKSSYKTNDANNASFKAVMSASDDGSMTAVWIPNDSNSSAEISSTTSSK